MKQSFGTLWYRISKKIRTGRKCFSGGVPVILAVSVLFALAACGPKKRSISSQQLEEGFKKPQDSIKTAVYWYWISNNVSKEGVVKDLHAMKRAGINRAFIGNIGQDDIPYGDVTMFSDEWWDVLHTALKTATELDIEIGIFNSPGWSQSGGPWVKPEEAMRYLASSELRVNGPQKLNVKLEKPIELFEDVKVLAYPAPAGDKEIFDTKTGSIFVTGGNGAFLTDGNKKTSVALQQSKPVDIRFTADAPFTARSLVIQPTEEYIDADAVLTANVNGEERVLARFPINRTNTMLSVGFVPYAPIVISVPATESKQFTLTVTSKSDKGALAEVALSPAAFVERYPEKTLAKMHQTPSPYWQDYMWRKEPEIDSPDLAVDPSNVLDLTAYMDADGTLKYDLPEGEWVILRMGMTPTGTTNTPASPESTGYEVDKMSKKHVEKHFYGHMGEILNRIPEADRKSFKVVVQDSYETGGQNFTDGMIEEFKARYGYDPTPYLPVYQGYVVGDRMHSDRFLWDVRRMVADKVAYDYVGGLRDISHKHGLETWLENYGHWGFPGEFLKYGGQSDGIGGEFWSGDGLGEIECRAASSCGHIYGKNKIWAESHTSGGDPFVGYPSVLKPRGDLFFTMGINNTLLHLFISQPDDRLPGINAWFGNEFNRNNTWFSQFDLFTDYLKRTNYMLQQGLNVADVAYFIGEDAPKMTGVVYPELPEGYQFDYMNAEVIERDMSVKDGLLTLPHGTQYRLLVLPEQESMRPELLKKIKQLVENGAVVLGPAPSYSPSLQNQPEADKLVVALAAELWGDVDGKSVKYRKVGKGMVMSGLSMPEALELIGCVPDFRLPENAPVLYCHRTAPDFDIYFVSNQSDQTQEVTPEFRVTGRQPELWLATTGAIRPLPSYTESAVGTSVPLKLAPGESVFVVFRDKASKAPVEGGIAANYPAPTETIRVNGTWKVQFDASMRGPEEVIDMAELQLWNESSDERIKYYSGTADYSTSFMIGKSAPSDRILLDLGKVYAMAKVKVNGQYAGGIWTAPYSLDITEWVKEGENTLEIEVVNNWVNRLIGDKRLPERERKTWCPINTWKADSPLQPSGIAGPAVVSRILGE
ncbi:MAG: glycosyl hydrolase [Bacteroidales bacterium]|nr:glycosyl hydrolase [Bacteroidales bacterium]